MWQKILKLCGIETAVGDWPTDFKWAKQKIKEKTFLFVILMIAWSAYMYILQKERNDQQDKTRQVDLPLTFTIHNYLSLIQTWWDTKTLLMTMYKGS